MVACYIGLHIIYLKPVTSTFASIYADKDMNPVLSAFVKYWKGDSAPSPTDDQANSSGEQEIIEPRNQKKSESDSSSISQPDLDLNNNEKTDSTEETNKMNIDTSHSSLVEDVKVDEITTTMEEEERALHKETSREQQQIMDKAEKEWKSVEDKQRYLRLQLLLDKSNIYCQFLLERMERQKLEARKQQEKTAHQLQKKQSKEKDLMQMVPQAEGRVTRRALKKLNGSVECVQTEKATSNKRKSTGKKRKVDYSSSYMISEYIDKELLTKRHKAAGEENEETENPAMESSTLQCVPEMSDGQLEVNKVGYSSNNDDKSTVQPIFVTGGSLRPYQLQGLAWLKVLFENGMNGILADEMGLGKTLQCISLLAHLVEMGVQGPFLVAAPLSTLPNWVAEFHKFAPKIPVILYHGSQEDRLRLRYQMEKLKPVEGKIFAFPVVVTSYEICMRDQKSMHCLNWKYIIVDEGHRIKNLNCKLIRELKTYKAANRLLLTGTPLQNNLSELWSLLNFLLPDIFDDLDSFQRWFDFSAINEDDGNERIIEQEREHQVLQRLHAILTPFLLRRLKTDVELSLPPKKEVLVYAPLTLKQQTFYKASLDKTLPDIVGDNKKTDGPVECSSTGRVKRKGRQDISYKLFFSENIDEEELQDYFSRRNNRNVATCTSAPTTVVSVRMTNVMMQLRKCCNHPYLIECPVEQETLLRKVDEELVTSCGKMLLLDRMLPELKHRGHKVLLFSQMTRMMDILEDYCILRKYGYSRLDGQMRVSDRQEEIKKFEADPSVFVFLLSTRAGGLGLNLAVADTVIIYDSDWNPQMDLQAQDRCHRIGQTKPVIVYRFVTANTIDQKIVERASTKRKLEKMIIHKGKFKGNQDTSVIDAKELRELLEMSDHEKVVSSDDLVMSDEDLKALLDRSDLFTKTTQSKQKKSPPSKRNQNSGLFCVLDNSSDS